MLAVSEQVLKDGTPTSLEHHMKENNMQAYSISHIIDKQQNAVLNNVQKDDLKLKSRMFRCNCQEPRAYDKICIFISEVVGTAILLFIGCMGGIPWGKETHHFYGSVLFGLTVMTIIQSFGCVSGAHLNPAVTIAAVIYKTVSIPMSGVYIVAQLIGATCGFGLLKLVTPENIFRPEGSVGPGLCSTVPHTDLTPVQALILEYVATMVLIVINCGVWDPRNAKYQDSAPIKFGLAVAALSFAVGPYTGCSMNPARTFGPAIWNGDFDLHWVYWVGPIASSIFTTTAYRLTFYRQNTLKNPDVQIEQIDDNCCR